MKGGREINGGDVGYGWSDSKDIRRRGLGKKVYT